MEYPNIISAVPQGENFDASAVNEGVWLSVAHLNSIEATMAASAKTIDANKVEIDELNSSTAQQKTDIEASNKTIDALNSTIADKDAEIATLKAAAAGKMKETERNNDELGGKTIVVSEVTAEANRLRALRDGKK